MDVRERVLAVVTDDDATDLDKGVDSKNDKLRLRRRVVHEVEVDELLGLKVLGLLEREEETGRRGIERLSGGEMTRREKGATDHVLRVPRTEIGRAVRLGREKLDRPRRVP